MTTRKLEVTIAGDAEGLKRAFSDSAGAADGFGKGLLKNLSGPALKAGLAGAGVALGAVALQGFMTGMDNEKASDKVAATMVPGDADMVNLGRIAGDLFANAYGESLGEVQGILAELVNAGVDEIDLSNLGAQVADIGTAFDQDFTEVIRTARNMVNQGLVPDMESAFDVITSGMQRTGSVGREELLDTLNEYADSFDQLGIDGPTAIGLIDAALDNGAFNMDKAGDAIKEFSIRAIDGSTATAEAFDTLNLDMEELSTKLAEGGPAAKESFSQILTALESIKDPLERDAAGVALFGTTWEDLGEDVIFAMNPARIAVEDLSTAAEDMGTVLNDNLATDVEAFKRQAMQGISDGITNIAMPAIRSLVDAFKEDGLAGVVGNLGEAFKTGFAAIGTWLKTEGFAILGKFFFVTLPTEIGKAAVALVQMQLQMGKDMLGGLWDGAQSMWGQQVAPWFQKLPANTIGAIGAIGRTLYEKGRVLLQGFFDGIRERWNVVAAFFAGVPLGVTVAIGSLGAVLVSKGADVIRGLSNGAIAQVRGLYDWFRGLPGRIAGVVGNLGGVLVGAGRALIGGLISGINAMLGPLRSAVGVVKKIVDPLGGSGVGGFFTETTNTALGAVSTQSGGGGLFRRSGGPIPGGRDQPVPMVGHGGEFMLSADVVDAIKKGRPTLGLGNKSGGGGAAAGMQVVINLHGPATHADGQRIVQVLRDYQRIHGPLPVTAGGF